MEAAGIEPAQDFNRVTSSAAGSVVKPSGDVLDRLTMSPTLLVKALFHHGPEPVRSVAGNGRVPAFELADRDQEEAELSRSIAQPSRGVGAEPWHVEDA
jgi:hypothetical protein